MNTQIVESATALPMQLTPMTPMHLMEKALVSGVGIDVLRSLFELHKDWSREQARLVFDERLARAKAKFKPIIKQANVYFKSKRTQQTTDYDYEELADVCEGVDEALSEEGLSYRWRVDSRPGTPVTVTCILTGWGYFEECSMSGDPDESGNKNSNQQRGSTVTYLERYTLKAALGIAAKRGEDTDGRRKRRGDAPLEDDEQAPKPKPPNPNAKPAPAAAGPRRMPVNDQDAVAWTDTLWALMAKSKTNAEVDQWLAQNAAIIEELSKVAPQVWASLCDDVAALRAKLKETAPKPPNPNAKPAGEDMPRSLMRNSGMLCEALIGEIRKDSAADLDRLCKDPEFYKQREKLEPADQDRVDIEIMKRRKALVSALVSK